MASFNKVMLMGNLTRDVEIKQLPSGSSIAQIGLAVNEKYKDKDDQWVERTNFIDCEMFGKRAEVLANYLSKGSPLFIEGRLRLDTWQDKADGSNRSKLKVVIEDFQFVGGGKDAGTDAPAAKPKGKASTRGGYEAPEVDASDLPF